MERSSSRFAELDLKGILADYAADAVFFTPDGPLKGVDSIRGLFEPMLAEFAAPGAKFSLQRLSIEGEHGYIVWSAEMADNVYELVTDTFVVRNGKIAIQSYAGRIVPRQTA